MMWFYTVYGKWSKKRHFMYILFKDGDYYKAVGMKISNLNRKIPNSYKCVKRINSDCIFHASKIPLNELVVCDDMKKFMYDNKILLCDETIYYYAEVNFSNKIEKELIDFLLININRFNDTFII